jgi:protein arginine kinase
MLERMEDTARQILESERKLCEKAKSERAAYLTDRAMRARAILSGAHLLSADEFLHLSADVRFGVSLGILQDISPDLLNTLLVEIMPCTMTLCAEQPLRTAQERDLFRAALVKQRLGA